MARSSLKHRNTLPVKEDNGYSSSNNNKRLLNEDSGENKREMQRWGTSMMTFTMSSKWPKNKKMQIFRPNKRTRSHNQRTTL